MTVLVHRGTSDAHCTTTKPRDGSQPQTVEVGDRRVIHPFYDHGGITIYNADCRKVVPWLERFDLLLTDPPYGLKRFANGKPTLVARLGTGTDQPIWWDERPTNLLLCQLLDAAERSIVWGANNFGLPESEYFLVWDKEKTVDNFASAELAYTNVPVPAKVFRYSIHQHNKTAKVHPTQKPLALMKWCLSLVPDATTLVDPFMGSGTTLVAAKEAGMRAVGIEINEEYCQKAVERLRQGVLPFTG